MKYGTSPNHIFKIITTKLSKVQKENIIGLGQTSFIFFKDLGIYSESGICVYNDAIEHWVKTDKGWEKDEISN